MKLEVKPIKDSTGVPGSVGTNSFEFNAADAAGMETFAKWYEGITNEHTDAINNLNSRVAGINNEIEKSKTELNKQSSRNIEIIGIFSAVLALLIIDASVIKSVESLFPAMLLIVGMTCSLSMFAALIHDFFGTENKGLGTAFWLPISLLAILVFLAMTFYYFGIKIPVSSNLSPTSQFSSTTAPNQ